MKKISILGSTGSIGVNTLKVIKSLGEGYKVVGLSARRNVNLLVKQIKEFKPEIVALMDEEKSKELEKKLSGVKYQPAHIFYGLDGLIKVATYKRSNFLVSSLVGAVGLIPTLEAIRKKKTIALANKEILVMAGEIIIREALKYKTQILSLDSEHSAIFQCLRGEKKKEIKKIILTASGGPFYHFSPQALKKVTVAEALNHPTWSMGKKITIDSATLMNKGLELIEAHYLFGIDIEKIKILVHPQSIIHSMVEFIDGAVIAQLGITDMRLPLQFALTYPHRRKNNFPALSLEKLGSLTFANPDFNRFPCLHLAIKAARKGESMPTVLNAANEIAVDAFLNKKIKFMDIPVLIQYTMNKHKLITGPTLEDILSVDSWTRNKIKEAIN